MHTMSTLEKAFRRLLAKHASVDSRFFDYFLFYDIGNVEEAGIEVEINSGLEYGSLYTPLAGRGWKTTVGKCFSVVRW